METQNKSALETLIDNVPTDTSGKWVKKEELYTFAMDVADYVLTKIENNLNKSNLCINRSE